MDHGHGVHTLFPGTFNATTKKNTMVMTTTLGGMASDVVISKIAVHDSAAHMRFVVV